MRPPFNSFHPQPRPRPQHQNFQQPPNGYQNPMQSHQMGITNPQLMSNPYMGYMNNSMPNMQLHPQFLNNHLPNMPQHQQQHQQQQLQQQLLHQLSMPNSNINQLLPNLLGNLQFAAVNGNLLGHSLPLLQQNLVQSSPLDLSALVSSQAQLNSFNNHSHPPIPTPHQNHSHPPIPTPHQNHSLQPPMVFSEQQPQGQPMNNYNNNKNSKGNGSRNRFTKNSNFKGPDQGSQRSQFHQADNMTRKFGFNKDHKGKGHFNKTAGGFNGSDASNIAKEKKRSFALVYTEKEIQQWREERQKHYPTKANVEKKRQKDNPDCNIDDETKKRSQQLKEILAAQAKLGVEVADVPSHYLSNISEEVHRDKENDGQFVKRQFRGKNDGKGRFQNRFNKRRHGENSNFSKKPRFQGKNSSDPSSQYLKKPTLLEKLISADVKRDKQKLLQVIRFAVMNEFFVDWPGKPLNLPLVKVRESGCEQRGEDASCLGKSPENVDEEEDDDDDDGGDDDDDDDASLVDSPINEGVQNDVKVDR